MAGIEVAKNKFGIKEDITDEKVAEIRNEFPWVQDLHKEKENNLKKEFE